MARETNRKSSMGVCNTKPIVAAQFLRHSMLQDDHILRFSDSEKIADEAVSFSTISVNPPWIHPRSSAVRRSAVYSHSRIWLRSRSRTKLYLRQHLPISTGSLLSQLFCTVTEDDFPPHSSAGLACGLLELRLVRVVFTVPLGGS